MTDTAFEAEFRDLLAVAEKQFFGMARRHLEFERQSEVYIRIGPRYFNGERRNVITIASISVHEKVQRTGVFTRLITTIQRISLLPIHIENALDPAFAAALVRRGFSVVSRTEFTTDLILESSTGVSQ